MPIQESPALALIRTSATEVTEAAKPWAEKFVDYAALAALVYGDSTDDTTKVSVSPEWKPMGPIVSDKATSLDYQVWLKAVPKNSEIAIVFRGTHEVKDWWSNLRFVTRLLPIGWDQYDAVRQKIAEIASAALKELPGAKLVTVGHSLGGGLAQQAAYAHPDIDLVVAFDSSPLTGYRSVPEPAKTENPKNLFIYRVYEKGEILAYFRGFLRQWLPLSEKDPSITEVRFNLTKGQLPVAQHSMVDLALRIAEVAKKAKAATG